MYYVVGCACGLLGILGWLEVVMVTLSAVIGCGFRSSCLLSSYSGGLFWDCLWAVLLGFLCLLRFGFCAVWAGLFRFAFYFACGYDK